MTEPIEPLDLRGKDLLRWVINKILAHPEHWDQSKWHCGTSHCFLGWADVAINGSKRVAEKQVHALALGELVTSDLKIAAHLGIEHYHALWIYVPHRTLAQLYVFCREHLADRPTLDRDGIPQPEFRAMCRILEGQRSQFTPL